MMTPWLDELPNKYTHKIFEQNRSEFNLRLCLKGIDYSHLMTSVADFEVLDWSENQGLTQPNHTHQVTLTVTENGVLYGFAVWLTLQTSQNQVIDILENEHCWIPVFLPVFPEGLSVTKHSALQLTITRKLIENHLNCDYRVDVHYMENGEAKNVTYYAVHNQDSGLQNAFYDRFMELFHHRSVYNLSNISDYLAERLPKYMRPQHVTELAAIPLSLSGKIDRTALTNVTVNHKRSNYKAPRSEFESQLCTIWSEVLGADKIGIEDDFFRLGGDSILSIQICSRIRNIGYDCSIKSIFDHRTISALIQSNSISELKAIVSEQGELLGESPLLPIQSWFFEQHFKVEQYFNQSFLIKVPPLDVERLSEAFNALSAHHDALRFSYSSKCQTYQPITACQFQLEQLDINFFWQINFTCISMNQSYSIF